MQPNSELQFTEIELQFTLASEEVLSRFATVPEKSEELPAPAAESLSWFGMAPGESAELLARFAILPGESAE